MANENGEWIMHGVSDKDPSCIRTMSEMIDYINEVGFLPLFKNEIEGFSVEEHTNAKYWWTEHERDPWLWRELIARSGKVAYGKFFDKKTGFISLKWLPYFANCRRDGYDFDALWDDEKASYKSKKIMDCFDVKTEYLSPELKETAGFGKGGEKNFDGVVTNLQMQTYLVVKDLRKRRKKDGTEYGWSIAVYATPEHVFGEKIVRSAYKEDPKKSEKRIIKHFKELYPSASESQIKKVIGMKNEDASEKAVKKVDYPQNLLKDLNIDIKELTDDQIAGLEFVTGQLKKANQEALSLRYREGLTYKKISEQLGKSETRCSQLCNVAVKKLANPKRSRWIIGGYRGRLDRINELVDEARKAFIADGKTEQAKLLLLSPAVLPGITANQARLLISAGIDSIGALREALKEDFWTVTTPGIGYDTAKKILDAMYSAGLIDESFEAYKEWADREYFWTKWRKMYDRVEATEL